MTAGLPKIDESISETSLPAPPVPPKVLTKIKSSFYHFQGESTKIAPVDESNMTINKTCDMTAGIGLQVKKTIDTFVFIYLKIVGDARELLRGDDGHVGMEHYS